MPKQVDIDITVPNQTKYLGMIGKIGEGLAHTLGNYQGDREELAYHLNLVLTEALSNAICHANAGDPTKEVRVSISAGEKELTIRVFDQGKGFDINRLADVKVKELAEGGRGVQIIFKVMDQVRYLKKGPGHVLEMTKKLH